MSLCQNHSHIYLFQVYNDLTCSCECDTTVTCPPMFTYDEGTCSCVCDSSFSCPERQRLDTASCQCVCESPTTCPTGQTYDSSTCRCECNTEQQCCEGQVFDESSCSCRCESTLSCSSGYVFDSKSCRCVCEGSISEDVWNDQFEACKRDHHKLFSIFSCGCECPKYLKCPGKKIIDPNTCRCVCPTTSCTSPKYLDPYTCDCQCSRYQQCDYGYQWDSNECRCKCQENLLHCWGKKIADLTTCRCVCPETSCVHPKVMNNYTCGCECGNYQQCSHGYHWDSDECRCKCWERPCPHGHKFNKVTCKCESMCPHANTRCHRPYYTFDYDTCQCKCSRTCRDHEVLDSECRCRRKQQPTTTYTSPPTSPSPLNTDVCSNLRSYYDCYYSASTHGVSCRYVPYTVIISHNNVYDTSSIN